eukprot:TRINITY_DN10252_c0_g2_i1.p1 TRINITY_DN10252_c0_g2~~TRINITY_DN10252_c0_g2_i1.p1  ORF type:complete len:155 (+),score=24.70 TRINITY_DN10252_c0_g2_i1:1-465(+)
MKTILAIDYSTNWSPFFSKQKLENGEDIKVEQAEWKDISISASSEKGITVHLKASENPFPFTTQKEDRVIVNPDFVLIRNFPTNLHGIDYKSTVMGFMYANTPSINSFHSIFMCMNRVLLHGELTRATEKAKKILKRNKDRKQDQSGQYAILSK